MTMGQVLSGFTEAPITFPPSYRRVRGEAGSLPPATRRDDGANPPAELYPRSLLERAYTLAAGDGTARTPSYTDRVLCASLPGMAPYLKVSRHVTNPPRSGHVAGA